MSTARAVVLPFIGVPPGICGICMGAAVEPLGGRTPIGMGAVGVLIGSGLCLTVYAASRHAQD